MRNSVIEPYEEVANAIIIQAVTDYRAALRGEGYRHRSPEKIIKECESFFRSYYFSLLTKVSGEFIIEQVRKEAKNERNTHSTNS